MLVFMCGWGMWLTVSVVVVNMCVWIILSLPLLYFCLNTLCVLCVLSLQFWQAAGGPTRLWMHHIGAIRNDCGEQKHCLPFPLFATPFPFYLPTYPPIFFLWYNSFLPSLFDVCITFFPMYSSLVHHFLPFFHLPPSSFLSSPSLFFSLMPCISVLKLKFRWASLAACFAKAFAIKNRNWCSSVQGQ